MTNATLKYFTHWEKYTTQWLHWKYYPHIISFRYYRTARVAKRFISLKKGHSFFKPLWQRYDNLAQVPNSIIKDFRHESGKTFQEFLIPVRLKYFVHSANLITWLLWNRILVAGINDAIFSVSSGCVVIWPSNTDKSFMWTPPSIAISNGTTQHKTSDFNFPENICIFFT